MSLPRESPAPNVCGEGCLSDQGISELATIMGDSGTTDAPYMPGGAWSRTGSDGLSVGGVHMPISKLISLQGERKVSLSLD